MMITRSVLFSFLIAGAMQGYTQVKQPVDYVNPFIGTSNSRWMLFPGATMPNGMVKLSPDNQGWVWQGGYDYSIGSIQGFSFIHGWTMAGLLTMPANGDLALNPGTPDAPFKGAGAGYHSRFSHNEEQASPGYYSVYLRDPRVKAELTATERTGVQRYTFPADPSNRIMVQLNPPAEYGYDLKDAVITKVNSQEIQGHAKTTAGGFNEYTLHFVMQFSKPFTKFRGYRNWKEVPGDQEVKADKELGVYLSFPTTKTEQVIVRTGISFVSIDQARLNLATELKGVEGDFDALVKRNKAIWNKLLSAIQVKGGTEKDKIKFYTNLYRCFTAKMIMSDANGKYMDACENTQQLPQGRKAIIGGDAFWNTYWNLNGLWSLISPGIMQQMVETQLEMYEKTGWTSKGPAGVEYSGIMEGSHEMALMTSAYQKGIIKKDADIAWQAMKKNVEVEPANTCGGHPGNPLITTYASKGYVPIEKGVTSKTLDYAYDDWCVAQMARWLRKEEDAAFFLKRSGNWRNVFDSATGYVTPRKEDGAFITGFDPFSVKHFIEGNSWQYSFYVPHDIPGVVNAMGKDRFLSRLREGFQQSAFHKFAAHALDRTEGQSAEYYINHGNEVNMQAAYLFNYAGRPDLTQYYTRKILDTFYDDSPYIGWNGDEDEGQMGAWFVLSALGLFEMNGGTSPDLRVDITSPLFSEITIQLDPAFYSGKTFVIKAWNNSARNIYIQSIKLNGQIIRDHHISFQDITKGGKLELWMGPSPANHTPAYNKQAIISMSDSVKTMAEQLIKKGFNAGDGYGEVWIRDLNTFMEVACKVNDKAMVRKSLITFILLQQPDGAILDGYVSNPKGSGVPYNYYHSPLAPGYAGHKNTVETDQESSLIQAIAKYIRITGDRSILTDTVAGKSIQHHLGRAMQFLLTKRFSTKYGLIWGATTADWGDVQPEHDWGVELNADTHQAIDIYDNAMFVIAINDYLSFASLSPKERQHWINTRDSLKMNIRRHLWDEAKQKYRPHIYLNGSPFPAAFDESEVYYHGGTAVAIEAGLLSKSEVKQVYDKMKQNVKQANAATIGLTLYPVYPAGSFKNGGMGPYSYQNGGDWTWFGGRMVSQLIRYNLLEEAHEAIEPMLARVLKNKGFYEWYTPGNQPQGSAGFKGEAGVLWTAITQLKEKVNRKK